MPEQQDYSTKRLSQALVREIGESLRGLDFGSIEIYVTDSRVTQITKRTIRKTISRVNSKEDTILESRSK